MDELLVGGLRCLQVAARLFVFAYLCVNQGFAAPAAGRPVHSVEITSPDRHVVFTLNIRDGALSYAVTSHGITIIEPSAAGIILDGANLAGSAAIVDADRYATNTTYATRGVHSVARDESNGARITVRHTPTATLFTLDARAYNDGIAFRFLIPGDGRPHVPDAASTFALPTGSTVWYHGFRGHYEGLYTKAELNRIAPGEWLAAPLTLKLPGSDGYAVITESALANYSGMALQSAGTNTLAERLGHAEPVSYPFELRYGQVAAEKLSHAAAITGTITTPWRVIIIGRDLNTLVNSDLVTNLAPPPDPHLFPPGTQTQWVKPGRAVWKYLDGGENTLEGMKEFSRLAGQLGFEYNVIEGFWQKWTDEQLRDLVDYSAKQGVGIFVWKHSRDLRTDADRQAFFKRIHDAGVVGAKIDFFDHEAKDIIDVYQALLRAAAENHILLDFHGANKPTGEERTWPNELTREGVLGFEHKSVTEWAPHDTTLPFTRFLAGPADFTPVLFGERRRETSWAHQIATAAVFTSPLLVYAANPKSILENPGADIIKSIPAVWDETIALPQSEIGSLVVFARRKGDQWFLAVLNSSEPRKIRVDLSFLGNGPYRASLLRDDPAEAAALGTETGTFSRKSSIDIDLRSGGGFLGRFTR